MNPAAFDSLLPVVAGSVCGIGGLFAMRRFSDQAAIRIARAKIRAHLYELRLFGDEPLLMFKAQRRLVLWNLRYLRLILVPAVIVAIPALFASAQLDALYGKRALRKGEAAVITATLTPAAAALDFIDPVLSSASSFVVETPSVRIPDSRQIYWRVRAAEGSDGWVRLTMSGESLQRPIHAGPGLRYVSGSCSTSIRGAIIDGCRIQSRSAESIAIDYPSGAVSIAGFELHWAIWFAVSWFASMLIFRKRAGVAF